MLFNTFTFVVFLSIVFSLHWFVLKPTKVKNLFLLLSSYIFYGCWNWKFLFLMFFTCLCSYLAGGAIEKHVEQDPKKSKMFLAVNVIVNLLILGVFKYYNFFIENISVFFHELGFHLDFPTVKLILPVGISFYTFQAISYTIDVYRRKIDSSKDPIAFFSFISFFPQLVAGPIERAINLLPQFEKERKFDYNMAVDGCRQMLWGYFKKMVIADGCAYYVNPVFAEPHSFSCLALMLGAVLFAFQIYADFSGYSSIAIGCAKLFGIQLQPNFLTPYFSKNIVEFWRRWHISLNRWFVDYVYIPFGGSRVPKIKIVRNVFVVFLLSGLWHGADWTFVLWGLFHACLFLPYVLFEKTKGNRDGDGDDKTGWAMNLGNVMQMIVTFGWVTIGWVFFRSASIAEIKNFFECLLRFRMYGEWDWIYFHNSILIFIGIVFMLVVEWLNRECQYDFQKLPQQRILRIFLYVSLITSCILSYYTTIESENTFIYFQF